MMSKADRQYIDRMNARHSKMLNPVLTPTAHDLCYSKTYPAHKCEKCRYMWECIKRGK